MLWIALNLPQLPLDLIVRSGEPVREPAGTSTALPLIVLHKKRIGWCNASANQVGILCGMSEAQARSRSAVVQVHTRDLLQEQQALQEAALWALNFTPHVTLRPPLPTTLQSCGLIMEVAPSLRLFNGLHSLLMNLAQGIAESGLLACWAIGPTAAAAWLLAQNAPACCPISQIDDDADIKSRLYQTLMATSSIASAQPEVQYLSTATAALLDALPLNVLDITPQQLTGLEEIGCHTIGQLRQLPRAGITRRFGAELLIQLDRAYGTQAQAHEWFAAPVTIDLKLLLPAAVDHTHALVFASRRLVQQMTGWLTAHQSAITTITLWLHHEPLRQRDSNKKYDINATPDTISLAMPSPDAQHLELLLSERLAQVKLSSPVIEIALTADRIVEQTDSNTELFPTISSDIHTINRLMERLQSRLGTQSVRRLGLHADHRPEHSYVVIGLQQQTTAVRHTSKHKNQSALSLDTAIHALIRPGWLLPQPLALKTRQHKPFYQTPLTLLAGPERIEAGWWDDALALRDYFIAQNDSHLLLWIFRMRPDACSDEENWFLHGFFA